MAEPTEFQRRVLDALMKWPHAYNLDEIAARVKSNRLAVYSAARSLQVSGWAVMFRSDSSQWAVLKVAPSQAWRDRVAARGVTVPAVKACGDGHDC